MSLLISFILLLAFVHGFPYGRKLYHGKGLNTALLTRGYGSISLVKKVLESDQ